MLKKLIIAVSIVTLTLLLTPACAEQDKDAEAVVSSTQKTNTATPGTEATEAVAEPADEEVSVMDLPVDFSSPENVEKSIETVRQQAGELEALKLNNALGYILTYDLSLGRDKAKMYKKLDGRTPNEIIAKMKR